MRSFINKNPAQNSLQVGVEFTDADIQFIGKAAIEHATKIVATHLADVFIKEHGQEVLAKLDPQAIANLAIAASGAAIRETLEKKIPSNERIIEKAVVYQRGILGGIRRI